MAQRCRRLYSIIESTQETGNFIMNYLFKPATNFTLLEVRLHCNAATGGTENYVIAVDSVHGTPYDVVLNTQAMAAVGDVIYTPTTEKSFELGDGLLFTWLNAASRTWGLEIIWERD